jgi:hypothetical protein
MSVGKPKGLKKSGGRVKGVPNKKDALVKNFIDNVLDWYDFERAKKDLLKMSEAERAKLILGGMLNYRYAKLSSAEVKNEITVAETQIFEIGGQKIKFGD